MALNENQLFEANADLLVFYQIQFYFPLGAAQMKMHKTLYCTIISNHAQLYSQKISEINIYIYIKLLCCKHKGVWGMKLLLMSSRSNSQGRQTVL